MSFHKAEGLSEKDIVSMQNPNTVILVVEDEVLIRMDVVDQLGALGYRLIEAANGQEALDALSDGGVIKSFSPMCICRAISMGLCWRERFHNADQKSALL